MPTQLSRHSVSMSTLPVGRSRSNLPLIDEELDSSYSRKSLSSFQRATHPRRPTYHAGKVRAKYNYLDDIEVQIYAMGHKNVPLCF